jgi:hypothetical protein
MKYKVLIRPSQQKTFFFLQRLGYSIFRSTWPEAQRFLGIFSLMGIAQKLMILCAFFTQWVRRNLSISFKDPVRTA